MTRRTIQLKYASANKSSQPNNSGDHQSVDVENKETLAHSIKKIPCDPQYDYCRNS